MTKEKLIEKYKEFTDKQVNLTPREINLFQDFLLESINEVLKVVVPKEEYANVGCTYGDTELDADAVVYGINHCRADIISKAEEMGFKIGK